MFPSNSKSCSPIRTKNYCYCFLLLLLRPLFLQIIGPARTIKRQTKLVNRKKQMFICGRKSTYQSTKTTMICPAPVAVNRHSRCHRCTFCSMCKQKKRRQRDKWANKSCKHSNHKRASLCVDGGLTFCFVATAIVSFSACCCHQLVSFTAAAAAPFVQCANETKRRQSGKWANKSCKHSNHTRAPWCVDHRLTFCCVAIAIIVFTCCFCALQGVAAALRYST